MTMEGIDRRAVLLERWMERVERRALAAGDPFRNPVEFTLRESFAALLGEALGEMNPAAAQAAIERIVRLRAVENLPAGEAVGFIFVLRGVLRDGAAGLGRDEIDARIDQMALWVFEEYTRCREQIAALRMNELRRGLYAPAPFAGGCSR
jgi:hypothetical protein